jgi:hypothetical protein
MNDFKLSEIKYGLIVIDPEQGGDMLDILHFCGYWTEPTKRDADYLREELMKDEEFGLTEIAHRVEILPAPDYILNTYIQNIKENE